MNLHEYKTAPLLVTISVTAPVTVEPEELAEAMVEVLMESDRIAEFDLDSFNGVQTETVTDRQKWFDVLVGFFLDSYRADDMIEELNTGVKVEPSRLRDIGRLSQARANADTILDRLGKVAE